MAFFYALSKAKDRSLRQLQGYRIPDVGAAEGCDLLTLN
jgi:hypothetical protein